MSQWGTSKVFTGEHSKIKVMPGVATDGFDRARPESNINRLVLIDVRGNEIEGRELFASLKLCFEGQPYRSWL